MKEGSSADEPTNINLSDYSSDEGDTSSCTDDETTDKPTLPASAPPSSPLCPRQKGTQKLKETSPKTNMSQPLSSYSSPLPRKILQVKNGIFYFIITFTSFKGKSHAFSSHAPELIKMIYAKCTAATY